MSLIQCLKESKLETLPANPT